MAEKPKIFPEIRLSQYHIIGVVIPGACVLLGLYAQDVWLNDSFNVEEIKNHFADAFAKGKGWAASLVMLTGLVFVLLVGHFVASLSSLLIDRMIVGRLYFYPYRRLLDRSIIPSFLGTGKQYCSQAINALFVICVFITIVACPIIGRIPKQEQGWFYITVIVALALLWFAFIEIFFVIVLYFKKSIFDHRGQIDTYDKTIEELGGRDAEKCWNLTQGRIAEKEKNIKKKIKEEYSFIYMMSKVFKLFSFPRRVFQLDKPFRKDFQKKYFTHCNHVFGKVPSDTNAFWMPALSTIGHGGSLGEDIRTIFYQYQMMRNLTMSAYILFVYQIIWDIAMNLQGRSVPWEKHVAWLSVTFSLYFFFQLRYWNLYYNWFSKTLLRCFVIENESKLQARLYKIE